uniref:Uncharacterized protein n=1 Tax=Anopheles maculatus TaxID=74869 RepID=A0A182T312_9DIPT
MRYLARNFNAFACCCSLLLLPLGGLADAEIGGAETPAKAPNHQHHHQPQSVYQQTSNNNNKLHQPTVAAPHHHQPAQHPDASPVHYHQQVPPPAPPPSPPPVPDRALSRQPPSSLATSPQSSSTQQSSRPLETRNSYTVLSQAMSQAVHHEFGMYWTDLIETAILLVCFFLCFVFLNHVVPHFLPCPLLMRGLNRKESAFRLYCSIFRPTSMPAS